MKVKIGFFIHTVRKRAIFLREKSVVIKVSTAINLRVNLGSKISYVEHNC